MKRLQKKRLEFKGGITVFLSLIFILLLSLVGAMIQSAAIQTSKSIKRADMSLALENVFAEYHVKLLEEYNVFAKEGSSEREIVERLGFYGIVDTEHEIVTLRLLSDSNGQAFYEQAVRSMGGTDEIDPLVTDNSFDAIEKTVREDLNALLQKEGQQLPNENNPIESIKKLKNTNLLSLIYPNPEQLSNRNVKLETLPTHRNLKEGIGIVSEPSVRGSINQILFVSYLSEYFFNVTKEASEHPLAYEVEYLLGGYANDRENLKFVAEKILGIRVAINYAYLLTDQAKQTEADIVALTLSSLMTAPEAREVVKQAILFAWAYGESIVDLRTLMKEKKVPLIKTAETWQLQLSNLFQLETGGEIAGEGNILDGVTYKDYVKALLAVEEKEVLCMRALDLLELNTGIKVDECVTQLEIKSKCKLRRNITYTFMTGYEYE